MTIENLNYALVEKNDELQKICRELSREPWIALDTEFIGEKRFQTLLCLIQVASPAGYFVIDSLQIDDLTPFTRLLENRRILKITHAGDNDYKLFYSMFGTIPKNIFDTQVAVGFVGPSYPVSYQKLLERELKVQLGKDYTVSNWDKRPLNNRQLLYALNDVYYLYPLYEKLWGRITRQKRQEWALEEFHEWETEAFYQEDPYREVRRNKMLYKLNRKEKVFLARLYSWRKAIAEKKDISKEMVLPEKVINLVVKNMNGGKGALHHHRRIPGKIVDKHWAVFKKLYDKPPEASEKQWLDSLPRTKRRPAPKENLRIELLQWMIKFICHEHQIAPELVLKGASFTKIKKFENYTGEIIGKGWRKELLGPEIITWINDHQNLELEWKKGCICLKTEEGK